VRASCRRGGVANADHSLGIILGSLECWFAVNYLYRSAGDASLPTRQFFAAREAATPNE
jgi:hypothetical protein